MNKVTYSAFIIKDGKDYLSYVPDLDASTEGRSVNDAIAMTEDLIGIILTDNLDCNEKVPKSTLYENCLYLLVLDIIFFIFYNVHKGG